MNALNAVCKRFGRLIGPILAEHNRRTGGVVRKRCALTAQAGTMTLPLGHSAIPESFRCARAKDMPMMVTARMIAVMTWPNAVKEKRLLMCKMRIVGVAAILAGAIAVEAGLADARPFAK